jgi:LysM repeat protein
LGTDHSAPRATSAATRAAFAAAPTAPLPGRRHHTVRKGETLAAVAKRYRVPSARLAEVNGLAPGAKISRGEILVIPGREPSRVASKGKVAGKKKAAPKPAASGRATARAGRSYQVRGGDTLYRIARRTGTSVDSLMTANNLDSATQIRPGDRLKIPAAAPR